MFPNLCKRQRVQPRLLLRLLRSKDKVGEDGHEERAADEERAGKYVE